MVSESSFEQAEEHTTAEPVLVSLACLAGFDNSSFALGAVGIEEERRNRHCRLAADHNSFAVHPGDNLVAAHRSVEPVILAGEDLARVVAVEAVLRPGIQSSNSAPPLAQPSPEAVPTACSAAVAERPIGLAVHLEAVVLATAGEEYPDIAGADLDTEFAAADLAGQ